MSYVNPRKEIQGLILTFFSLFSRCDASRPPAAGDNLFRDLWIQSVVLELERRASEREIPIFKCYTRMIYAGGLIL